MHHQGSVTASARWWHHLSLVTISDVCLHMEAAAQGLGLATLPPAMRLQMCWLKPPAASGATAATAESSETAFKLRFEVDGMASVLLLVGILTRLFRYVRMFFTQTDPMIF